MLCFAFSNFQWKNKHCIKISEILKKETGLFGHVWQQWLSSTPTFLKIPFSSMLTIIYFSLLNITNSTLHHFLLKHHWRPRTPQQQKTPVDWSCQIFTHHRQHVRYHGDFTWESHSSSSWPLWSDSRLSDDSWRVIGPGLPGGTPEERWIPLMKVFWY